MILFFFCGMLFAGSIAIHGLMDGYNPILKTSNKRYDAQIVKGLEFLVLESISIPKVLGPYLGSSSTVVGEQNIGVLITW